MPSYIAAMLIFGTIGPFIKLIALPSELIALMRAVLGALCLATALLALHRPISWGVIRRRLGWLLLSGAALGFNWIYLFEAYRLTSVASATVCYYMAPLIVMALAALLFKEKVSTFKWLCAGIALCGLMLTVGILDGQAVAQLPGVLMGLAAAAHYAALVLLNRKLGGLSALELSCLQLLLAAMILLPYVLWQVDFAALHFSAQSVSLCTVVGLVHTGLAYLLFFAALQRLSTHRDFFLY